MVCTEGNTNRDCSFCFGWNGGNLWDGGVRWMEMNNKPGAGLVALASEGSMPDDGRDMSLACNGGESPFWVFSVAIIWWWGDLGSLWV